MGYFYPCVGDEFAPIGGRDLRYVLTSKLRQARRPVSVFELVQWCDEIGLRLPGRASKVISDALRWEISWGRVTRLSRGVYQFRRVPRSTWGWIRRRAEAVIAHVTWAKQERAGASSIGIAPIWGPAVTTPPGSGRRTQQPCRPPFQTKRRRFRNLPNR